MKKKIGLVLGFLGIVFTVVGQPTSIQVNKLVKKFHALRIRNETGKQLNLEVRIPCLRGGGCATKKALAFTIEQHYDEQKIDIAAALAKNVDDRDFWSESNICFKDYYEDYSLLLLGILNAFYIPQSALSIRVVDPSKTICRKFLCDNSSRSEACVLADCQKVNDYAVDTGFVEAGSGEHVIKINQGTLRIFNGNRMLTTPIQVTKK